MSSTYPKSAALFEQTERTIPGGANSPVRAFRGVCGTSYGTLTELEAQLAKAIKFFLRLKRCGEFPDEQDFVLI